MTLSPEEIKHQLDTQCYSGIPGILSSMEVSRAKDLFFQSQNSLPNHDIIHYQCKPHGIYKFIKAGNQENVWFIDLKS